MPSAPAVFITGRAQRPSPSADTARRLEGTLSPGVRAVSAPVPSAATITAAKQEAFRHAEVPALAAATAAAVRATAAADRGNQGCIMSFAGNYLNMERRHMRRTKLDIDKS